MRRSPAKRAPSVGAPVARSGAGAGATQSPSLAVPTPLSLWLAAGPENSYEKPRAPRLGAALLFKALRMMVDPQMFPTLRVAALAAALTLGAGPTQALAQAQPQPQTSATGASSAAAQAAQAAQAAAAAAVGSPAGKAQPTELQQSIAKSNAYVGLLNRALRASESWERYKSWVKSPTGPTGKERIVYGLYSLYDMRSELAEAREATKKPPFDPALDTAILSYADAYEALSPIVADAYGYYERKDYLVDKMAKGRELHARLAPAAERVVAERAKVEAAMRGFKRGVDQAELDDVERREGRKARWHLRKVMISVRPVMDLLPSGERPKVDMPQFDAALADYASTVTTFDSYLAGDPSALTSFRSNPSSFLGRLRDLREKLAKAKGDARRAGLGSDMTFLVNDYNMMVTLSEVASRSAK
jgi:hypothetical protein